MKIAYAIAASFSWSVSPLRFGVNPGWIYGLGYAPVLLLIALFNVCGLCEVNEDKALISQRAFIEIASAGDDGGAGLKIKRQWRLWSEWLGRIPGRRDRPATARSDDGGSVEMYPIVKDGRGVEKQVSTASTVPVRADGLSGLVNPFSSGVSSVSSVSSGSSGEDSMSFVEDVLNSLEGVEYR